MLNVNLRNQNIETGISRIDFKNEFDLNISQLIFHNEMLIIRGYPDEVSLTDAGFRSHNVNNIIALNQNGELLWQVGSIKQNVNNQSIDLPASHIEISDNCLKAYYQSDHEVWYNLLTGEVVKIDHVYKK